LEIIMLGSLRVERRGASGKIGFDHVGEDDARLGDVESSDGRVHLVETLAAAQKLHRRCDRLHCEGWSGGFEEVQVIFGICRRCGVEQEGYPDNARRDLLEQVQPLATQRVLESGESTKMLLGNRQWTFFSLSEIAPTRQSMATLASP
jgi:hypothetical protein